MTFSEYQKKYPLTKYAYQRIDVEKIRRHAFQAGTPEKKETRSGKQRRYQWGVVYKIIGDELGYTDEEVHQLMCEQFLSYTKDFKQFVKSTTKLNTKEMEEYLEQVRKFAAMELSINVPLPNESDVPYDKVA